MNDPHRIPRANFDALYQPPQERDPATLTVTRTGDTITISVGFTELGLTPTEAETLAARLIHLASAP